ncbi:MAG: hypothetical protein ACRD1R_14815 [Acidobacteriota bacterium]
MNKPKPNEHVFHMLERALRSGGAQAVFELLIRSFQEEKKYRLLFEALLMRKRHELGLPLIWTHSLDDIRGKVGLEYERAYVAVARHVGELFLKDGEIPQAWPYFHAIGEIGPVAAALEACDVKGKTREEVDALVEIALQEGAHPRKGIELILEHYGFCQAITNFGRNPSCQGKEDCIRLLVRALHRELAENLRLAVARREGKRPESTSIPELISGRHWLFEHNAYYIDSSHLASVVQFALEFDDRETLALLADLTNYGSRLARMFQPREHPPFDEGYRDYDVYVRALLGENVEEAVTYFRDKLSQADPLRFGNYPAQIVVGFMARLERFEEAIEFFLRHLGNVRREELHCPSLAELCWRAQDPQKLTEVARARSDLLDFVAGLLQMEFRRPQ